MCAPIPHLLRFNRLHNNLHSRVSSARRVLAIESRQNTLPSPILQSIPRNTASPGGASPTVTNLPVTTPPITALSPSEPPGLSASQGIQTLSINSPVSTVDLTSSAYVQSSSIVAPTSSFTPNSVASEIITSTVLGSATVSSMTASPSTWSVSSMSDMTSSLVLTTAITPVTTITPVISQSSDSTVTTTSYTSIQSTGPDNFSTESFTSGSSSTLSVVNDPSSSIVSSTTTNSTAPAVNTVTAPPISGRPENLSAPNPSFYVGIVLGTVAVIACLCALIAWFIRLRSHARRRRVARSLNIPWVKSDDGDTWGLGSGHRSGSDMDLAAISAMNLGSREDLADIQAWSPRGDRDVGEPKRAENYVNGSTYSLQNHPIPEYCLFNDDSVRAFASSEGHSTTSLLPHHNLRQLPSHLIDQELAARVSREHVSLRFNDNIDRMDSPSRINCGTPRETMNNPRFLSLRGDCLNVPWRPNSGRSPRSTVERLRNHGKPSLTEPPWEQTSSSQINNKTNAEAEPWSTSFKTSLVSAFNAVAANLSTAAGAPRMNEGSFTPVPPKRTVRNSVRDTFWDENVAKAKGLSRETSNSTVTSKAWTLEETREGAGIVRLFIPGVPTSDNEMRVQRPHLSGPILSFEDRDGVISYGDGSSRPIVQHSQVPLIASEKPPPPAVTIRPDPYLIRRNTRKTVDSSLSRVGSIYSTASMHIGAPTKNLAFQPRRMTSRPSSLSIPSDNPHYDDNSDSVVIEPSQISRLSSSDSSTTSIIPYGTSG